MKTKSPTPRTAIIKAYCTPADHDTIKKWANDHYWNLQELLEQLASAIREERIYLFARPGLAALMQDMMGRVEREARRAARKEVMEVLASEGFVTSRFER